MSFNYQVKEGKSRKTFQELILGRQSMDLCKGLDENLMELPESSFLM
jgi:hypothetical protein